MAMTKRKVKLEDGRYLIYFEFGEKPAVAASIITARRSRPRANLKS
jgi:hypothetical protein